MAYTTIDNPALYFQVKLYTGTGSSHAITLDGDENMQPDMVWWKERGSSDYHTIVDSVRGVTKRIFTNATDAEDTQAESLKSFDSDGFTMGTNSGANQSSQTYVAWCWKESADAGFDIVSWTGNGSSQNISHSLSAVPHFMITKNRSATGDWSTYHKFGGGTKTFYLSNSDAIGTTISPWNNTDPTSSVFTVGGGAYTNGSGNSIIGYLWTEKQGYSKFGSYTGNGDADGAFVYTGFRPAFVLLKNSSGTLNWNMQDNKRWEGYNEVQPHLAPNLSAQEYSSSSYGIHLLSNGFKITNNLSVWNGSGNAHIYMAFSEQPLVNSNGVPANAR